jgi:co-chaperonin GroES (HSP10)
MANATSSIRVAHTEDPKTVLIRELGNKADGIKVIGAQVLVAVYQRGGYGKKKEAKTAGGIYIPESANAVNEDPWQGSIGLVIGIGPLAFQPDEVHHWPVAPKIHDWIVFRVGETFGKLSGTHMLRFLDESAVRAIVDDPDSLY